MLLISFTYFYEKSHIHPRIYDIAHKIYHHQNTRKRELNCYLNLVVYDNSITITIEDKCGTRAFLIDNFIDYITIFNYINSSQ